jgi:hypothetical protein
MNNDIRELEINEMDSVTGGKGLDGLSGLGASASASAVVSNGNADRIVLASAFGPVFGAALGPPPR